MKHLTVEQRYAISVLKEKGIMQNEIAKMIGIAGFGWKASVTLTLRYQFFTTFVMSYIRYIRFKLTRHL